MSTTLRGFCTTCNTVQSVVYSHPTTGLRFPPDPETVPRPEHYVVDTHLGKPVGGKVRSCDGCGERIKAFA